VGLNEHCSEHFCKLHTLSILVCNHSNRVVQLHPYFKTSLKLPAFKTSLTPFNFSLKCW